MKQITMKEYYLIAFLAIFTLSVSAQTSNEKQPEKPHLYNSLADARADIDKAVKKAKLESRNVLF